MDDLFIRYAPLKSVQLTRPVRPTILTTMSIYNLYMKFHKSITIVQVIPKTLILKKPSAISEVLNVKILVINSFLLFRSFAEIAKILLVRVPININITYTLNS